MTPPRPTYLATQLVKWHRRNGRHDLPWQQGRRGRLDPYRVWVSEIMLQQTQVTTVIDYFKRFMERFPDIRALAAADADAVLHLWTGLGYYARARNLHRAAQRVVNEFDGDFPNKFDDVVALPGIGASTAGAILSLSFGQRVPILDGNVKRVLARFYRVDGWPGDTAVAKTLWRIAEHNTPVQQVATYTQAIMDLGATVCRRRRPACELCPLAVRCRGRRNGDAERYPASKPKKAVPVRVTRMLMIRDEAGQVLLERRPPSGVWGGLWSLPELPGVEADAAAIQDHCRGRFGVEVACDPPWSMLTHTFTHFKLEITPQPLRVTAATPRVADDARYRWIDPATPQPLGFAAPVVKLLDALGKPMGI